MEDGLILKFFLPILISLLPLSADMVRVKSLACPTLDTLQKSPISHATEPLEVDMYAIANNCVVVTRGDSVETLGYDPRNSQEKYVKIFYKRTKQELYILRSDVQIERGGKRGVIRF